MESSGSRDDYAPDIQTVLADNHVVLKETARIVSRVIIAGAALMALILAIGISFRVIDGYGRMSPWMIVRPSLIAAVFVVMAFVMISYLIKKVRIGRQP